MLTQIPNQMTYNYNSEEVLFEQLPESLRVDILCAEDFWRQYDAATTPEAREKLLAEHPYNAVTD